MTKLAGLKACRDGACSSLFVLTQRFTVYLVVDAEVHHPEERNNSQLRRASDTQGSLKTTFTKTTWNTTRQTTDSLC